MSTPQPADPRPTRGTVVPMPPRSARAPEAKKPAPPPRNEPAEPVEEPGYGHGV